MCPPHPACLRPFETFLSQPLCPSKQHSPDLLTFSSFMTKGVLHPTQEDGRKLLGALHYLTRTSKLDMTQAHLLYPYTSMSCVGNIRTASPTQGYSPHLVGERYTVYTKSTTQKITTTSSCEAELVAVSKDSSRAYWHGAS